MDNAIMIVAGDAIDASIGVKLGVSTMAAAGLGNTLSDCIGLFTGDWIESLCKKAGIREPKLTDEQLESPTVRWTKTTSSVVGLAIGCLLGMSPLAIQTDRKRIYFSEEQEDIYETLFQPHGVSMHNFFDLMNVATWHDAEAGTMLAARGKQLRSVFMLCRGSAVGAGDRVMLYSARADSADPGSSGSDAEALSTGATLRGRFIGATCLVDPKHKARDLPYPYEVRATSKVRYVEWPTEELQKLLDSDKAIESAVLTILYADLAESMRRLRVAAQHLPASGPEVKHDAAHAKALREYSIVLKVATADDFIHPAERKLCHEFRLRRGLSAADHTSTLEDLGWTTSDWARGYKGTGEHGATRTAEDMRQRIPELLRSSGISSRVVEQLK